MVLAQRARLKTDDGYLDRRLRSFGPFVGGESDRRRFNSALPSTLVGKSEREESNRVDTLV